MIEGLIDLLTHDTLLTDKMDTIIEAFVSFYGEERRAEIESKLRNVTIMKFGSKKTIENIITDIKACIFKEVFNLDKNKFVSINLDRFIENIQSNNDYWGFTTADSRMLFNEEIEWTDILQKYNNHELPVIDALIQRYEEIKPIIEPYVKLCQEATKEEKNRNDDYYEELLREFMPEVPQEYINKRIAEIDNSENEFMRDFYKQSIVSNVYRSYFDSYLNTYDHCFDSTNEAKINDPKTPDWKKSMIKRDRVSFLKANGFENSLLNVDEKYEELMKREEVGNFINRIKPLIERIVIRKNELYKQMNLENVESFEDYKKCRRIFDNLNLVNKDDPLSPFVYDSPVSCYHENYTLENGEYKIKPVVLINMGISDIDETIIHECNHAFEQSTISVDKNGSKSLCGRDRGNNTFKSEQDKNDMKYKGITRNYELINEFINEVIAQEITNNMRKSGQHLFETDPIRNSCAYLVMWPLLDDFYINFKDIIINSRTNGNINYLYEQLGEENFNELSNLCNEYYSRLGFDFKAAEANYNYKNGIVTNNSQNVFALAAKSKEIINRMKEYNKTSVLN